MPYIDTSKIEGFDKMTDAEKIAALTGFEIPDAIDLSGYVKKTMFDAKCTELAAANKKLKGKMTEDEAAEAARAEKEAANKAAFDELQSKYDALQKKFTISSYKTNYLQLGYDEKSAQETAEALANGEMDKVFAANKKHAEAAAAKLKEQLMMGDPRPGTGGGSKEEDSAVKQAVELAKAQKGAEGSIRETLEHYM